MESHNDPVIRLHLNRKRNQDKCTQLKHAASGTCQTVAPPVREPEKLFITELLTDYQTTVNVEIPGEVLMNENDIDILYNSMKNDEAIISQPERKSLWKYIKLLNTANAMRNSSVCAAGDVLREIGRKSTNEYMKVKNASEKPSCKSRAVKVDDHKDMQDIVNWMSGRLDALERLKYEELLRECSCKVCLSSLTNENSCLRHCCSLESRCSNLANLFHSTSATNLKRIWRLSAKLPSAPSMWLSKCRHSIITPTYLLEGCLGFIDEAMDNLSLGRISSDNLISIEEYCPNFQSLDNTPSYIDRDVKITNFTSLELSDGDGFILFTDREPLEVSRAFNNEERVVFRIAGIDAPEAATKVSYGIHKGDKVYTKESCFEFGLDAKRFLCRQLQCARSIYIQQSGFTDQYNRRIARLLVKYNENVNEKVDLAQVLLENGHAFCYTSAAPIREYYESQAKAILEKKGIWQHPKDVQDSIVPWKWRQRAKSNQNTKSKWITVENAEWTVARPVQPSEKIVFKIEKATPIPNEDKLFVGKSLLKGAGNGLFLREHESINKGEVVCVYSNRKTKEEILSSAERDYAFEDKDNRLMYLGYPVKDLYYGPIANDCSLKYIIEEMEKYVASGQLPPNFCGDCCMNIEKKAQNCYASPKVDRNKKMMFLVADKTLPSTAQNTELYISYGFTSYWIPQLSVLSESKQPEGYYIAMKRYIDVLKIFRNDPEISPYWVSNSTESNTSTVESTT